MFDCVCGHVRLQAPCIYVSFIAVAALVGLVFVVLTPVGLRENKIGKRKENE